ncbi:MAG: glucuronate isomerase, partial [Planctomycetota bacterium]
MAAINDIETLDKTVRQAVAETSVTDIHTHLFPPSHEGMLLWGVDELLTYHYLVAELFTMAPADVKVEDFWKLSKREQADLVWEHVFQNHGGLSEAARGAITTLTKLGFDLSARDLKPIREWFDQQNAEDYLKRVFDAANIDYAVMTNDPFKSEEVAHWQEDKPVGKELRTALRIDPLLVDWSTAVGTMNSQGYDVALRPDAGTYAQARQFLSDWADRLDPLYMAASLPPEFAYPSEQPTAEALANAVLPVARERNLPVALMI